MSPSLPLVTLIRSWARNKKLTVHGDGASKRSYLHVKDVAAAFDIVLHKGVTGQRRMFLQISETPNPFSEGKGDPRGFWERRNPSFIPNRESASVGFCLGPVSVAGRLTFCCRVRTGKASFVRPCPIQPQDFQLGTLSGLTFTLSLPFVVFLLIPGHVP